MSDGRRLIGFRRVARPLRSLSDYMIVDRGVVLRETGKPDNGIEAVYEGDSGWQEVKAEIARARSDDPYFADRLPAVWTATRYNRIPLPEPPPDFLEQASDTHDEWREINDRSEG